MTTARRAEEPAMLSESQVEFVSELERIKLARQMESNITKLQNEIEQLQEEIERKENLIHSWKI